MSFAMRAAQCLHGLKGMVDFFERANMPQDKAIIEEAISVLETLLDEAEDNGRSDGNI